MPHDKQINKNSVWAAAKKKRKLNSSHNESRAAHLQGVWGKGKSNGGGGVKGQRVGVRVERVFYKSINLKRLSNADSKFFTLPKFFLPHSHTHTHPRTTSAHSAGGCGINLPTANSELRTAKLATVQMLWQMPHMSIICLPFFLPPKPKMIRQTPMHNIWQSISPVPPSPPSATSCSCCHCVAVE